MKQKKMMKKKVVSEPIPSDILIDIFSRVPANSIARFRCVSKLWASIPSLPGFTELFLTKSLARPRLLFAIEVGKELFLFSSLQPQNPAENSSLVATRYKCFPNYFPSNIRPPLSGLVFLHDWRRNLRVIYNPVTGESITLPEVKANGAKRSFFGYDPISKRFKVLCMTWSRYEPNTHQVLTLGSAEKHLWRSIECNLQHSMEDTGIRFNREIWINGVLYYGARSERYNMVNGGLYYRARSEKCNMIVWFDLSCEKFGFIKIHEEMLQGTLINYKGKLGALVKYRSDVVLWVLEEDAGKHKWSKSISVGLSSCDEIGNNFHIVGMTGAGEIVFSPYVKSHPFYIVYYNIERKTFTRVNVHIQGFEEFKDPNITPRIFLDYVENMKLL
ncbi:unnamed protein product [Microthlaspi erraticum]|uniref:F-box domain-containing protein n=1 Tax=Microthlaspi erraticum TaxID=1685480 RepID=A0A6D2HZ79_9BRAS|nr:unnamed protein product [Microthlaspi erraticum]